MTHFFAQSQASGTALFWSHSHVNLYRSFQPHRYAHVLSNFSGSEKVSTAKLVLWESNSTFGTYDFYFKTENELKIDVSNFLPWKAKHTGKIVAHIARTRWRAAAASQHRRRTRYRAAAASHAINTLWLRICEYILRDVTSDRYFAEIFNTIHYRIIRHRKGH